ncbi:MAG: SUMF1/EgtB/PvdO family nonheme iron enzyme [Deltaproteobacteria bacterium]|nr:SUMF1/EgtB/PvdO family nonheme iron enzyme [Deltaproteobacteria bacterium]
MSDDGAGSTIPFGWARKVLAAVFATVLIAGVCLLAWHHSQPPQRCAPGMIPLGTRCCGEGQRLEDERCLGKPSRCAAGMKVTDAGCVPTRSLIVIAGGRLELGPIDWEAQQRVRPYAADVPPFALDSHEVTEADWAACVDRGTCPPLPDSGEPGRARTGVSASEAEAYCRAHGGSLPTRDQLAFASLGPDGHRYPWGATGAVCRRAAFGLERGPCAEGARGPELSGSHPDGVSPAGVHDLAGNVAEWTAPTDGQSSVRGGSWQDGSAADLRGWSFVLLPAEERSPAVGFRCAYPPTAAKAATPAASPSAKGH